MDSNQVLVMFLGMLAKLHMLIGCWSVRHFTTLDRPVPSLPYAFYSWPVSLGGKIFDLVSMKFKKNESSNMENSEW